MNHDESPLATLFVNFALLSLFAIGGVNVAIPEMHRQAVEVYGWMSDQRFTDLFAIAQAAPGPNLIVVTLIGWEAAGVSGAIVATVAIAGPSSILALFVGRVWHRHRFSRWRVALQAGLLPVTIGLVLASAYVLGTAADSSVAAVLVTLATAAGVFLTRIHPLLFLAVGGALGALGLL